MIDKRELHSRLTNLHKIVSVDIDALKPQVTGIPDLYRRISFNLLNEAIHRRIHAIVHDCCKNRNFKGNCRLELIKCYRDIIKGMSVLSNE